MARMEIKPEVKSKIKIFVKEKNLLIDATTASYIAKGLLKNMCPFLKNQLEREDSELAMIYAKKSRIHNDDYYIYYYKIKYKNGKELEIGVKDSFLNLPVIEVHMISITGIEFQIWPIGREIDQIEKLLFILEKTNKVKHLKVWFSDGEIVKYRVIFTSGLEIEKKTEDIEVKKDTTIIKAFEDGRPIPDYSFKVQKAYEMLKKKYDWVKNMKEIRIILKGNKIMKYDIVFGENNSISVSSTDGIDIYKKEKPTVETYLKIQDKEIKVCSISSEKEKKINTLLNSLKNEYDNIKKVKVYFENNENVFYKYELFDKEGKLIKKEENNNILLKSKKVQEKKKKVVKKVLVRIPKGYESYIRDFELIRKERNSLIGKIPIENLDDKIMFLYQ